MEDYEENTALEINSCKAHINTQKVKQYIYYTPLRLLFHSRHLFGTKSAGYSAHTACPALS